MAETRALDRSVPLFHTADPIDDPLVASIRTALLALAADDRPGAMKIIDASIARPAD